MTYQDELLNNLIDKLEEATERNLKQPSIPSSKGIRSQTRANEVH